VNDYESKMLFNAYSYTRNTTSDAAKSGAAAPATEVAGGLATTTGIGAAVGVPTIAVSATLVAGGVGNIAAGIRGLSQSMMSSGSGSSGPNATPTPVAGSRVTGEALKTQRAEFNKVKPEFWKREAATSPEKYSAENLKLMRDGFAPTGPDGFPMEIHHITPLTQGGANHFSNLQVMTRTEHRLGANFKANHPNLSRRP
jgi:hypothetical protein